MKYLIKSLLLIGLLFVSFEANAATCFWVTGTASFDSVNTASWASGSAGTPGTCAATGGIPKNAGDIATFDASSGGGTVTVCGASALTCPSGSGVLTIAQITMGAFTGTLDFATNNPAVTLTTAMSITGAGTRTLNMGSGTWTLSGAASVWNVSATTTTGLVFNKGTANIVLSGNNSSTNTVNFLGGGLNYNTVSVTGGNSNPAVLFQGTGNGFTSIAATAPAFLQFNTGQTHNISSFTLSGTSGTNVIHIESGTTTGATATISMNSASTLDWGAMRGITCVGATLTATNTFNLGGITTCSITAPTSGGGGHIIGG